MNDRRIISNGYTIITAEEGNRSKGGAPICYHIVPESASGEVAPHLLSIEFQSQPLEKGVNGVTNENLLTVMIDRLKCFQKGPHPCKENEEIVGLLKAAMVLSNSRAVRIKAERSK